jgi:hypothetical protein
MKDDVCGWALNNLFIYSERRSGSSVKGKKA